MSEYNVENQWPSTWCSMHSTLVSSGSVCPWCADGKGVSSANADTQPLTTDGAAKTEEVRGDV